MIRSVLAVIAGYMIFGLSAVALFGLTGRDPHQHQVAQESGTSLSNWNACSGPRHLRKGCHWKIYMERGSARLPRCNCPLPEAMYSVRQMATLLRAASKTRELRHWLQDPTHLVIFRCTKLPSYHRVQIWSVNHNNPSLTTAINARRPPTTSWFMKRRLSL